MLRNLHDALEGYEPPGHRRTPIYLVPRNIGPPWVLGHHFLYMPQNALGWSSGSFPNTSFRYMASLRFGTHLFASRAIGIIPIARNVPRAQIAPLQNVLDAGYDEALSQSTSVSRRSNYVGAIVAFGPFGGYKNTETLLRGFETYRRQGGTLRLVLIGVAWPSASAPIRQAVASAPSVTWQEAWLSRAEMIWVMERAAATVFPSICEASPVTILEALAVGSPVIASDIQAHRDIIHSRQGRVEFFAPRVPDALAQRLANIEARPDRVASDIGTTEARRTMRDSWGERLRLEVAGFVLRREGARRRGNARPA